MTRALVVQSGTVGTHSFSRMMADEALAAMRASSAFDIKVRDLAESPVPHISADFAAEYKRPPGQGVAASGEVTRLSDELIAELKWAELIVVAAPMYQLTIPSVLKAYIDHTLRHGHTVELTPQGPKGLLAGRRVLTLLARGAMYSEPPYSHADFQKPYLAAIFGIMGLEAQFIVLEGTGMGPGASVPSLDEVRRSIREHDWLNERG